MDGQGQCSGHATLRALPWRCLAMGVHHRGGPGVGVGAWHFATCIAQRWGSGGAGCGMPRALSPSRATRQGQVSRFATAALVWPWDADWAVTSIWGRMRMRVCARGPTSAGKHQLGRVGSLHFAMRAVRAIRSRGACALRSAPSAGVSFQRSGGRPWSKVPQPLRVSYRGPLIMPHSLTCGVARFLGEIRGYVLRAVNEMPAAVCLCLSFKASRYSSSSHSDVFHGLLATTKTPPCISAVEAIFLLSAAIAASFSYCLLRSLCSASNSHTTFPFEGLHNTAVTLRSQC